MKRRVSERFLLKKRSQDLKVIIMHKNIQAKTILKDTDFATGDDTRPHKPDTNGTSDGDGTKSLLPSSMHLRSC